MFDFSIITNWIDQLLRVTLGLGDFWSILIECVLIGAGILVGYALIAIALIFMERKVCAYFQCRQTALCRGSAAGYYRFSRCFFVPAMEQWCNGARLQCGRIPVDCHFFYRCGRYLPCRMEFQQ